jgi:hypothetical protein
MRSAIDDAVAEASHAFVEQLGKLNSDPYVREAVMKLAVREVAWAMLDTFDDQQGLADQLETMADVIREHKHRKNANDANEG